MNTQDTMYGLAVSYYQGINEMWTEAMVDGIYTLKDVHFSAVLRQILKNIIESCYLCAMLLLYIYHVLLFHKICARIIRSL